MCYIGIFIRLLPIYMYLLGATSFSFLIYIFSFLFLKKHHFTLEKYAQSDVNVAGAKALIKQIKLLFESEAPYLDPDTSLQVIAKKLDTKPRSLSQAVNEIEQMNF